MTSNGPNPNKTAKGDLYKKYSKTSSSNWLDPSSKLKPSDLCKSSVDVVADDYPKIIEFNNIQDNTCQVHSTVDIDQPLFQPSPKVVVFEDYAPFAIHEKKLFFRNNDSVARRIKVHRPKTPFFEISAPKTANGEPLQQTKIAAGMEIYYVVRFKPQQVHEYSLELVCSTEREKFIVPIRAVGMQPRMTFPDEIAFGTCAVKSTTRKTLLVQNVGSSVAKFYMRTTVNPGAFTCPNEELIVEAGASQMIELFFSPQAAKVIDGEIEVEFANKLKCYISVNGMGRNVDVSLSTPSVAMEPSYISLSSQKTMRIKNTSDVPINFVWKSFSSQEEEEAERGRLLIELNRMEAIEQDSFRERLQNGFYDTLSSGSANLEDFEGGGPADDESYTPLARADAATLMRKYRNLRTALDNDPMQFVDDIFEISPVSGNVWARSEIEITITFRPDTAAKYTCLGYLDISGRQDRLSLHLSGQGIGPHAALSFDVLDVGDVFINDEQWYELSISNKGDIPAQWSFLPSLTRFGNKFDFSPKQGYLAAGQSQPIRIRFESDVLGEFSEVFRFALQGNDDVLACQLKGHVVGPTFHFDCGRIDFGIVSFDYLHSTKLRLVNTSKIAMIYNLHVPQDGTFLKKEFDVEPKEGTLNPGEFANISIEFIPSSVKVYDYSLAVDVLGVGESLLSVPITAECRVQSLKLVERDIIYGDVFIRYPYERELLLFNPSDVLHTKFEMMPQLAYTKYFATYEAEPSVGVIEPGDTMRVTMRLVADKLANFKMPILISIAGSKEPPLQSTLQYSCVGPRVKVDATEVRWGNIDCLKDSSRTVTITNDSLISAHLKIFLKMARSKFELSASEMVLEPNQSYELTITANLDDSVVIKDEVHIVVDEGDDIMIPLSAKGVGTTMFCGHDLNSLDLGVQLTNCNFERKIVLENKGRRVQQLKWINTTVRDENVVRANKVKGMGRDASRLPKHLAPVDPIFTVTPEEITLRPRTATTFTFKGFSATAAELKESFILESKVGKDRQFKQIAQTEVKCSVVNPLLEFSLPKIDFIYSWEKDVPAMIQRQELVFRNASAITLTFVLSVDIPFNLSSFEHTLAPGDSYDVSVEFDPLYKDDKASHTIQKLLTVAYRGHPQKDTIPLSAEIIFPNLAFDASTIAFGCVLNDSSKVIKITATNTSKVVAAYEWQFVDEVTKKKQTKSIKGAKIKDSSSALTVTCDQVFDIMPVRSALQPGESEEIVFTMSGMGSSKVTGAVICAVTGGPEYTLPISGEASTVSYALDKSIIDFGSVIFTDRKDDEIGIINNGRVAFFFDIFPLTSDLDDVVETIPPSGKVSPGERFKVTLRVRPAVPTAIVGTMMFRIAHFDPVGVPVYCVGIFPSCVVSLARHARIGPYGETSGQLAEIWEAFTNEANDNVNQLASSMLPPPLETMPPPFSGSSAEAPVFLPPEPVSGDSPDEEALRQFLAANAPKSLSSATKGPQQLNLEVEMQRMVLCHHLNKKIAEVIAVQSDLAIQAAVDASNAISSGASTVSNSSKGTKTDKQKAKDKEVAEKDERGLQALVAKFIDLKEIHTANYICDFGNVIIGQVRKKVFQVFNASQAGQVSWTFEKKFLSGSPFNIEPDRVSKLPEHASIDFVVKCNARSDAKLGRKTYALPLEVKGSGTVNILLSGNFCVPELELSVEEIDFGRVFIGRSKQMFVRLFNTSPVTAQWKIKPAGNERESRVTITPSEGNLRAGRHITLCLEFIPQEARQFSIEKVFKIESNKKTKSLKVSGEGVGYGVRFEPSSLEMSPIIPYTAGDEKVVTIHNNNDVPIEIYSIDYDTIYREEEGILSSVADIYDEAGLLRCDIRNVGDGLPREVLSAQAAAERAAKGEGTADDANAVVLVPAPIRTHPAPRDEGKHQDILIVGPPLAGMSTLAENMSKKLVIGVKFVDTIIEDVANTNGELGQIARRATKRLTAQESAELQAKEAALQAAAEQSKIDAEAAYQKSKAKKKGPTPDEIFQTPEVAELQRFQESGNLTVATLAEIFRFRFTWDDTGYGCIIDGLISQYADEATVLAALHLAFPSLIVSNVLVNGGEEGYSNKLSALYYNKFNHREESLSQAENCRKTIAKLRVSIQAIKDKEAKQNGGTIRPASAGAADTSDAVAPLGDESWLKAETGTVLELDPLDYKALDIKQKLLYNRQYLYQLLSYVDADNLVIAKILRIWSPEGGLKQVLDQEPVVVAETPLIPAADADGIIDDPAASAVAPELDQVGTEQLAVPQLPVLSQRAVLYTDYLSKTIPALAKEFTIAPVVETPAVAEPIAAATPPKGGRPPSGNTGKAAKKVAVAEEVRPQTPDPQPVVPVEQVSTAPKEYGVFDITVDVEDTDEVVSNVVMALLPAPKAPPPDKNAVPIPRVFQVIRKPHSRIERKLPRQYSIVAMTPEEIAAMASAESEAAAAAASLTTASTTVVPSRPSSSRPVSGRPASGRGSVAVPQVVPAPQNNVTPAPVYVLPEPRGQYRWLIPPQSSTKFKVKFQSQTPGKFDMTMRFEALGSQQNYHMHCSGVCELPNINRDTRNLFMRRVKAIVPGAVLPQRRFVTNDDLYCFGPLLMFKKPEWRNLSSSPTEEEIANNTLVQTNVDIVRLSNTGKFKATVELGFQNPTENIFFVEPNTVELEEGETKDVKIWAFPNAVKEFNNTLLICVTNNPSPLQFKVRCWGVEPTIELQGPWNDGIAAAEAAVAACTDKKLIKDLQTKLQQLKDDMTLDFERQLIDKTEQRSYQVTNTSLLPIAFEIDPGEFRDSPNMSIAPLDGIIPAQTTIPITLSFTSPQPLMLTGKFSMRYSDSEGGLQTKDRVGTKGFRGVGEVYKIIAVSLTAEGKEEGGSEIDFGLLRVGDYASQILKMANRGKYRIGFKFEIPKGPMANMVKIEPEEGIIESGTALTEIKVTFCCSTNELNMKGNKDIKVLISEPLTGELVETFPLYLNAVAKYNSFRMQPAKGISFGAVRFDSESKSKRVELRNECPFEFVYVVCPAKAEIEELDELDVPALGCYAFNVPAAIRKGELGEGYLQRLGVTAAGAGAAAKGKEKAPPAKGKAAPAAAEASKGSTNPLVFDPDGLPSVAAPTDPLKIGSFKVFPRIGVVQPGQSVGIDATFDPSGCGTVHERLRVCITGVNPKDPASVILKNFELTGESCVPAIVVDDPVGIFEEQEVVSSLAECMGQNLDGASAKIEKMSVGKVVFAEAEKVLAFGPVMCGTAGSRGVVERVKITNPTKIDTKVNFKIVDSNAAVVDAAATGDAKGKGKDAKAAKGAPVVEAPPAPPAFVAQPETWEIPPHECRFVNIYFNPTEIKSYRAIFSATVDTAGSTTTAASKLPAGSGKLLTFDIAGSGTIPCISIEQPTERSPDGSMPIEFGRVHINRSAKRKILLSNDGVMPVTCLFEMNGADDFQFSYRGASLALKPGEKGELVVRFSPRKVFDVPERTSQIKLSVLNNQFDSYTFKLKGTAYACDALLDTAPDEDDSGARTEDVCAEDAVVLPEVNLAETTKSSSYTIKLKSRSANPVKFNFSATAEDAAGILSFAPKTGHLGAGTTKEITVTFSPTAPISLTNTPVVCSLNQITYVTEGMLSEDLALCGQWDDSMKSVRVASAEDLAKIQAYEAAVKAYNDAVEAEKKKGKKGKPVPPLEVTCNLQLGPAENGQQLIYEIVSEPKHELVTSSPQQQLQMTCSAVADSAKYLCPGAGENIPFRPTFMYQAAIHKFSFTNDSNITMPINWSFDDIKRRATATAPRATTTRNQSRPAPPPIIPCPFSIEPENAIVKPKESVEFCLKFQPLEVDDFVYLLKGETLPTLPSNADAPAGTPEAGGPVRMVIRGTAKRPVCHIDMVETPDYLTRRPPNMPNEFGMKSPIETGDLKVVELESCGLKTRNTYRFHISNPTGDNYEFGWEAVGESSPAWRCVQSSGMLFSGKRVEMVFEYLPEETAPAEAFFKFRLPSANLEQLFLFAGKVIEPKVALTTSRIDFHSVMLGGEGSTETVYLENNTHLPFNFAFEKGTLMQLEGPHGSVLDIQPKTGTVLPHGRTAITFAFKPQEEVSYNFNIQLDVKRKPNKLSINIKGEGYAVHPLIQLEQSEEQASLRGGDRYLTLRPAPAVNYADFGAVQVLDSISKKLTVLNSGKYNFDYIWDTDAIGNMLSLTGNKLGGTLHKGQEMSYNLTFAPQREASLDGSMLSFTVAGKYVYNILGRGIGVKPALQFAFMHHDFGPCFVTSPGGSTVIEPVTLRLVNHDPSSNITIECIFQKTRALSVECPPTVLEAGGVLDVVINFAPREVKDYEFVVPFIVNGTTRVNVSVLGKGINARVELVSAANRRTNFGIVNVGSEVRKPIQLVNKSKKAVTVQLLEDGEVQYGAGALQSRCVSFFPKSEFTIGPKETSTIQLVFGPNKRISTFSEDLLIRFAGLTRKLLTVAGKAQGLEVTLDTDSLPFGTVVMDSQKVRKVTLENSGDLPITFQWMESTFGPHFSISPLSGKINPANEVSFQVKFKPKFVDEDIRQEGMLLSVPGVPPMLLTCSGSCVTQPSDSIQTLQFKSLARKQEVKSIKITNPTDKDWYVSPSLQGVHWNIPHELKVPAKGSADLLVTFYPLAMAAEGNEEAALTGQLFLALPDGTAQLYKLRGFAGPPECAGNLVINTAAKKPSTISVKLVNWLSESQKFKVSYEFTERSTPASFVVVANAVEIGPNGTKEFPARFVSFAEGVSKGTLTFTNPETGEYAFYNFVLTTTPAEILETISMESPVRQTARSIITLENPLPATVAVGMGKAGDGNNWWSSDSKFIRVTQLSGLSGNTEGNFEIEFRPLAVTPHQVENTVTIFTKELGLYIYKVILKSTPPTLRQLLRFEVPLGSIQTETFIFKAFNTIKVDFSTAVQRSDVFALQKTVSVDAVKGGWDGDEIRVPISFEPTQIGEVRDVLEISSAEGGTYTCELVAVCVAPLPQGPFNLVGGAKVDIPFRNCFSSACNWAFALDSSAFALAATTASVNAKSQGLCSVSFMPKEEHRNVPGGIVTGKLFVTCSSKPDLPPWVFYLRGKVDEEYFTNQASAGGKKK